MVAFIREDPFLLLIESGRFVSDLELESLEAFVHHGLPPCPFFFN